MSFTSTLREYQSLSTQQWIDRASRTLPRAITVLLVVAIAWELVQLTWLLLERKADAATIPLTPLAAAPAPANKGPDIQTIVQAHLFGLPQAAPDSPVVKPSTANLVLSAVFALNDPKRGLAVIGEASSGAKVYTVGQTIRDGPRLHEVYPDRVILDRNGQLEQLNLPKQNPPGLNVTRPSPAPTASAAAPNQTFVDSVRRLAENNPSALGEVVRAQTAFDKGVLRGFRVYPGRNRQMFAKLGLQPGDLVMSINGTPLDDPQRAQDIFNTISLSDRVTVMVERNGQPQELTLNTSQISLPDSGSPPPRNAPPGLNPNSPRQPVD